MAVSKISSYHQDDEKSEVNDYESEEEQNMNGDSKPNYTDITKGLYK